MVGPWTGLKNTQAESYLYHLFIKQKYSCVQNLPIITIDKIYIFSSKNVQFKDVLNFDIIPLIHN